MKNKKSKLSLDQFKAKLEKTTESLDLISGGILGACHDDTTSQGSSDRHMYVSDL